MHSIELFEVLRQIDERLRLCQMIEILEPWVNPAAGNKNIPGDLKNTITDLLYESQAQYYQLKLDPSTRKIMSEFGVDDFYEAGRVRMMMAIINAVNHTQEIYTNWNYQSVFYPFVELMRSFRRLETALEKLLVKNKQEPLDSSRGTIELEFIEYSGERGFSPQRVETLASSLKQLHSVMSMILGIEGDQLIFKSFDSGSDVRVYAECAKAIAEAINTIFIEVWQKALLFRYDKLEKNFGAVSSFLDISSKIDHSVEAQVIDRETGEKLKAQALREVAKLTGIGVVSPMDSDTSVSKRQLLAEIRETKLLGDGDIIEKPEAQQPDI